MIKYNVFCFKGGTALAEFGSKEVASAAVKMALTASRDDEASFKAQMSKENMLCCAVDFGGDFISSVNKIVERTVVSAKRGKAHHCVTYGRKVPGAGAAARGDERHYDKSDRLECRRKDWHRTL